MHLSVIRSGWVRTLAGGLAIYALVTAAAVNSQNIHLLPALLVLGSLLIPVTFVVYLFERLPVAAAVLPALQVCFIAGGSVGVAAASVLEYHTLRELGALSLLAIGLIEESAKLLVPLWLFSIKRFRAPADGVLFGVAAGMGFAALETMGYGLVALIQSGGRIGTTEQVLLLRGLLSPLSHAAWTGLICGVLWQAHRRAWFAVPMAFVTAVALHAAWNSTGSLRVHFAVALLSGLLLGAQIRLAGGDVDLDCQRGQRGAPVLE